MNSIKENMAEYSKLFREKCIKLRESMQDLHEDSFYTEVMLISMVNQHLTPSFHSLYPEEWREGYTLLLDYIQYYSDHELNVEKPLGQLVYVFKRKQEIGLNGQLQTIKQVDMIKEEETDLYYKGVEILNQFKDNQIMISTESIFGDRVES
jgi:hypothetical protein